MMANRYEEAFSDLLDLVRGGKEFHEKYHKNIRKSIGTIINLGDSGYAEYSSMVQSFPFCSCKIPMQQAFYHCSGLNNVTISQSVTAIGAEAFYCCIGLEDVLIPESVQKIGKKAFAGCPKLRIHGKEGSAAQQYAQSEGIRFVVE